MTIGALRPPASPVSVRTSAGAPMGMLLQVAGTIVTAGLFAYGIVFGIIGWATAGGPNIFEIFRAAPAVLSHPWFLPIWGALVVISGIIALIQRIRNG